MKLHKNLAVCIVATLLYLVPVSAQTSSDKVPFDPNVRYGKLSNGFTYYVLKNQEPKERASFYIVQNVGAILENDDQDGLAHFLEHMAFNGTKNFPDKALLKYLEQYGVTFGRNINAGTGVEQTIYMLTDVPSTKQGLLDSALLIIYDWADGISLIDTEIDKERGVIREEWRTYQSGSMRLNKESMKFVYKGSKYAHRDIIGNIDVINNFKYQTIKDFYYDWYRNDLQAVVVVGDFDAEKMEQNIKNLFGKLEATKNPKAREYYDIPNNTEPIIGILTDPEETNISFNFYIKHKAVAFEEKNLGYFRSNLISQLYSEMMRNRISELLQKGTPPFINGFIGYSGLVPKVNAYRVNGTLKPDNIAGGIVALLAENERVKRHGFQQSELERAKLSLLSRKESQFKERKKMRNDMLVYAYIGHFLRNEPAPGIENDFKLSSALVPGIQLDELNKLAKEWNTDENIVMVLTGPKKEGLVYPSENELLALQKSMKTLDIKPYEDKVMAEPLVKDIKIKGKVVSEKVYKDFGATEWTLQNGAKVVIKQTDFKDNEINLRAISKGGLSLYSDEDMPSANFASAFIGSYGLGNFDAANLTKFLTGKVARLSASVSDLQEGFTGSSSVKDFETLLQLLYSNFEQKRIDKDAFEALKGRYMAFAKNMSANIDNVFNDSVQYALTSHSKRTILFNAENLEKVNFETVNKIYKERFADAADFTFVFVGNIDPATAKPLIEKYIGGITPLNRKENWKDRGDSYPKKNVVNHFKREMQTPKATVFINFKGNMKFDFTNRTLLSTVIQLLNKKYIERVREDEGGTYGVRVYPQIVKFPREEFSIVVQFDTDPAKAEKLKGIIYQEVDKLHKGEINAVHLKEAREYLLKQREEQLRDNNFWISTLINFYSNNENIFATGDYSKLVNAISEKQITDFAKKHLTKTVNVEVVMMPKE
jgi:zinc protease